MKNKQTPKQRTIYWANLDPSKGSEQSGKRPVVVVSGDTMNENLPVCIVCPLSTKLKNYHTCTRIKKTKVNKLSADSEVITFQVRTISSNRLEKKIGFVTKQEHADIVQKIGQLLTY